ncbi:transposase [Stieleria mannarensis]|uniref:transposase n=1 Tax=Stieleria mannarensis TaxID=2755585 RepID=UPI00336AD764
MILTTFACVLIDVPSRLGLSDDEPSRLLVNVLRLRLLKITACVRLTIRRVVFHLVIHCPRSESFKLMHPRVRLNL